MTINEIQDQIIAEFAPLEDWLTRYERLIELGRALPVLPEHLKIPERSIPGCQSRVWLVTLLDQGRIRYRMDSDAMITRGIIALLLRVLDGQPAREILNADLYFIERIGLSTHLSPARANGVASMLRQMRADVSGLDLGEDPLPG